ncbi:MAG: glycosyltransferase involved in cell wall biosynthesis [Cryomorphaceae bacterium]
MQCSKIGSLDCTIESQACYISHVIQNTNVPHITARKQRPQRFCRLRAGGKSHYMSNQFKLLECNPQLGLKNGIHQDTSERFRDSTLSNYIQIAVAQVFSTVADKSLFSVDIENASNTDELRTALSPSKFNFLRSLDLSKTHRVLDLSEDFGGVAHFLADQVASVESVKIDPGLTRLSVGRCASKPNVCHISEDLNKLKLPSRHYDLIVVGQLSALCLDQQAVTDFLNSLRGALSDRGVLIICTDNQKALGKWLNSNQNADAQKLDFEQLYRNSADSNCVNSFERKKLRDALKGCGFAAVDFHANFSIGDSCDHLFSEDYLTSSVNALNHFYRLGSIDNPQVNEFLLYKNLWTQKRRIVDLASHFVVLAGASTKHTRDLYDNDFTHFPGTGRKPQWRVVTSRARTAQQVKKQSVFADKVGSEKDLVSQNLSPQPYFKGRVLVGDWLDAMLNSDNRRFAELVQEYSAWLSQAAEDNNFTQTAYDLLPFNIILSERGGQRVFETIDTEWQINCDYGSDFVLFRALFWFAFENKSLLRRYAQNNGLYSIAMFIVQYMPSVHQVGDLSGFVELEERIQAQIDNNYRADAVSNALLQSFDSSTQLSTPALQMTLMWGNADGQMDEANTRSIEWLRASNPQRLKFELHAFSPNTPILRLDPMTSMGSIKLTALSLFDSSGQALLELTSGEEIIANASLQGLIQVDDSLLALNHDPHLLFDLSEVANIYSAESLEVEIAWIWGQDYSPTLNVLAAAVGQQSTALVGQSNRLNQYRADIEYKDQRISDLVDHRTDLALLKDQELENKRLRHRLQHQIDTLQSLLHKQSVRNDELHGYLLMRPTTRGKRVLSRILDRLRGRPAIEAEPVPEVKEIIQESPLPTGELLGQNTEDYAQWVEENELSPDQIVAAKAEIEAMPIKPIFSILVPIYNTDPDYLLPMIESVRNQIYPYWQLCLVDDCSPKSYLKRILEHEALDDDRISVQLNDVNQGISVATNDALDMAKGDYIALLDHDDELSINALYENAKVINQQPDIGLIYSDEDKMDMQGNRLEPFFKPDYSPDLLDTNNYICHFTVIKKSIADEIGGFREGLDGSQDHDIILRAANASENVVHIPKILYHWRKVPGSTAVLYDSKSYAWEAGRKAVEDTLAKNEQGVRVEFGTLKGTYRVFREIKGEPLVSIIVPFKDKPGLLDACINSILQRSSYKNFEIVGVSNNSEEKATFERMQHFAEIDSRVRFVEKNVPFNFSEICNYGAEQALGEFLVLLNNDIEIISPDWIERMLEHAQRDSVGAVGGKLLYPNGRIQHAGVVVGMVGAAGHPHKFFPDNHIGYHGRLHMVYNVSAVTGAMMMMSTAKFKQVGGLDADNLAVAYNDVDLCLKLMNAGYINLFTPHAKATHHESVSRGYEDSDEKMQRLLKEQRFFLNKWSDFLEKGDPYYNPNLSLKNERFSLNFKE